ncbi:MAG: NAD-dependent DNA ligase LigA [Firmicutes bacterium]|nr:NAD-dependent DNA ligase LigA [Bacillota bacterium]
MEKKLERMKELIDILKEASKLYYQYSTSIMTDFEYDRLYDELVILEKETNTVLSNSPTINVEYEISDALEQVEHQAPMLSLSKTKVVSDLESFLGDNEGILSWKLDGLTIVLTYEGGKLVRGVTRGTGTIGEVVTENVKRFKNIPLTIPYKGNLVLRGEAVIKYSDFEKMNEELDDSTQYKNPRNLCSGSVRQLDSNVTAERNVNCIIFALISCDDYISNSKLEQYNWLRSLGFEVVEQMKVNIDNIEECVKKYQEKIKTYDIPSDGLVLTYDDIEYSNSLGNTAKYPRHSIAFKWQDVTEETTLRNIVWQTSRTGLINPVAIFDTVELEGTEVSRASVHNLSIMEGLKLGIGDKILVYKANMIIPQIAGNLTKSNNIIIPDKCPICNEPSSIIQNNDIKYLYCTNELCVAKLLKKLVLFCSRNAMNIDGISDAILSKLIEEKLVFSYKDLYNLEQHKEKIINFEGFGLKSYNNLIDSINKSRSVKLANFIYALGIPEIGLSRAKLICNKYSNDFDKIKNLTFEELSIIDGIGDVIASEWLKTFSNNKFIEEIEALVKEITFIDNVNSNELKLENKTFVITGSVYNFKNRDELVEFIESYGGKVVKAISNNVDYLINNDVNSTSSKNIKAKELNIEIISEETLLELVKE